MASSSALHLLPSPVSLATSCVVCGLWWYLLQYLLQSTSCRSPWGCKSYCEWIWPEVNIHCLICITCMWSHFLKFTLYVTKRILFNLVHSVYFNSILSLCLLTSIQKCNMKVICNLTVNKNKKREHGMVSCRIRLLFRMIWKKEVTSSPLLCNFASEYCTRKASAVQEGLKLNETHQLLVYGEDVNLLAKTYIL